MTDDIAPIGHNRGPDIEPETLREGVEKKYDHIFKRIVELTATYATVPREITDEETNGKAQELFKDMRSIITHADSDRKLETEPYRRVVKEIDALFKNPADELNKLKDALKERIEKYLEAKKERERKAREKREREERERAEQLRREAEEAERKKQKAIADAEAAEKREREARIRKEEEERKAAVAKRRAQRIQRLTPYLTMRATREAKRKELKAAERRAAEDAARAAVAAAKKKADDEAAAAKARANLHRSDERKEGRAVDRHDNAAADHGDQAGVSAATADKAEKRAERLGVAANASGAELSRSRSEQGAVGSLARRWTWRPDSPGYRRELSIEQIRPFIAGDAIDAAITKFVAGGGRLLTGVIIEEVEEARIV